MAQIEALAARKSEVEATLATLKADAGTSSADMSDDEIMRATLLDRALADLNFDRAKREAELATLMTRYSADSRAVLDKQSEIAVIDKAMGERREQIKVLGQTGALTDTSQATPESSIAEIEALFKKVSGQLDLARQEARDLNAKRATLAALQEDAEENRKLMDETRSALEVIRLEAGRALPGYAVLMSPPSQPGKPSDDSRKTQAVGGFGLGVVLALAGMFLVGLKSRKVRYSDALGRWASRVPVKVVSQDTVLPWPETDRLRNEIKLSQLRAPRAAGRGQIIALSRPAGGSAAAAARGIAESFARAGLQTLLIEADLGATPGAAPGLREILLGGSVTPTEIGPHLAYLPGGRDTAMSCGAVGVPMLRTALTKLAAKQDVVILSCGSLKTSVSAELFLSEADFALAEVSPDDDLRSVQARLARFDNLPRQGGAVLFTAARSGDPGLNG